jgi:tetratricopeptide (TPR) repeat protein
MPAAILVLLALMPQLVDRTNEPLNSPPAEAQLSPERRADIFMARKMYREAVESYSTALNANPGAAVLHNKLGIAYHQQILLDNARRSYERAIKLDKKFSQAINNLGTVYYAQRNYKKAEKMYREALKHAPNSASIHSNLGTAYFARRKFKQATEAYLTALSLDPDVFEHRSTAGTLLQERTVEDRARYFYFMAKAYAAAGIYDRALLYLRKALEDGYNKRDRIPKEPEFKALLDNPEFQQLVFPQEQRAELRP